MRRIVINADDFGMNSEVNHAIVEAFQQHLISSTTLMANMPGFDEACALARRYGFSDKIGVHLNLTEGRPLTTKIQTCKRFVDERGSLRPRQTTFRASAAEEGAIREELNAQVKKCLSSGIPVTHLDSHHHVHTEWAIGRIVIEVAKENRIPAVRLTRNCGPGITLLHHLYKYAYNTRLARAGLAKTSYFAALSDVPFIAATADADLEIVVHTRRAPHGAVIDVDGSPIERAIEALDARNHLVSYRQLSHPPSNRAPLERAVG